MSLIIELPGLYIDDLQTSTAAAIIVVNTIPEEDSTGASASANIQFDVLCTVSGESAQAATLNVWVNGVAAIVNGAFQTGFTGTVTAAAGDLAVDINPAATFTSEQTITVRVVDAGTVASTVDYTYTYITADVATPTISSVMALGGSSVRVTFNEAMKALLATGANDALNPANYSIEYTQTEANIAGVSATVTAITQYSSTTYDFTTDIPLTFGRTYTLTVGAIHDDAGNAIDQFDRTATFIAWTPPNWPSRRSFNLWDMFMADDHIADVTGDLEKMLSAYQDVVDFILWQIDDLEFIWDIDRAPAAWLDAMLEELGNPFGFELTENKKRKLLYILVDLYKKKGTEGGIRDSARFFLSIEITEISSPNADGWHLGEGYLGVDTYIGPSDQASLYTFFVMVDSTLDTDTRQQLSELIEYMKPAHTHYEIIEPASPIHIDHWSLGESMLGVETLLH